MSIKEFIRRRSKKRRLLDEFRKTIVSGVLQKNKMFRNAGITTMEGALQLMINAGLELYSSGDIDSFGHFIDSLYDIIDSDQSISGEVLGHIEKFGIMASRDHHYYHFSSVVRATEEHTSELRVVESVNSGLKTLGVLASMCMKDEFEEGVLEVLEALLGLHSFFEEEEMQVNMLYLKNVVISIIASAVRGGHTDLAKLLKSRAREVLELPEAQDEEGEPKRAVQDTEPQPSMVVVE
ncbi:MAG: hypothetical protein JSV27_00890 [Candidatus Bathyarchaeota archaeon]|nr:MAG: hypothetical protein JSV27_00890 [Candidatus Bathyarchaeota archaeon]